MDPYFNSRGPRPASFGQSSYSFMGNLFEQNVFSEDSVGHSNQGPRLNYQMGDGMFYDHNLSRDRSGGLFSENMMSNQSRYSSDIPSSLSSLNAAYNIRPDNYSSLHNSSRFDKDINRDTFQTNSKTINTYGTLESDSSALLFSDVASKDNFNQQNQDSTEASDFSLKNTVISKRALSVMKKERELGKEFSVVEKENALLSTMVASGEETDLNDASVMAVASDSVKQMDSLEKAVDLSKNAVSNDKSPVPDDHFEESKQDDNMTVAIKQEQNDENGAAENETGYDSDKTIVNESVQKAEKIFKCSECDKVYRCESSLKKHLNIHAGTFKCKTCNKLWSSNYALTQHEKVHSGEREGNLCTTCGKTFFDSSSLSKHIKSVHVGIKTFACDRCELSFYARKTLVEHIRVHTGERPFKCKICPKTYKRISDLNHHIRGHTGETKHVCEVCGKGLRRLSELKVHMNQHRDDIFRVKKSDIICSWCGLTFKTQNECNIHTRQHLDEVSNDERDSALIAAAIDSVMPDERNKSSSLAEEAKAEIANFHRQVQNLYQTAGVKPSRNYDYILNSRMPVSDASFHAYFPINEKTKESNTSVTEIEHKETEIKQVGTSQNVDNWLNKNFASMADALQNRNTSESIQSQEEVFVFGEPEAIKIEDNISDNASDRSTPNVASENEHDVDKNVNSNKDINSENDNCNEDNRNVNSNGDSFEIRTMKNSLSGEKQKSIAVVIDKLAERKAKDLVSSETKEYESPETNEYDNSETKEFDKIEIKSERIDRDTDETDDYEIDNHYTGEEETTGIKMSIKLKKKSKSIKKQGRKQNMKAKSRHKQNEASRRKRKQPPMTITKRKQKSLKKQKNEERDKLAETGSVKSEKDSETDEFLVASKDVMIDGLHVCFECDKKFKSRSAFKKHKEMHSGLYTCSQCQKSLSSSWSLRQHMQTHSSADDRPRFPCNVCTKFFCDKSSLNKHVKSVHMAYKPFKCTECERSFSERKTMAEHMRTHTGERPFLCIFCPKTFKRVSELNHHIKGHTGETKHTCDTCGRGFRRLSELLRHITYHTGEKPYSCQCCGKEFRSFSVMREHTLRLLGSSKYNCERCGKKYFKKSHLQRHLRADRACTACKYCLILIEDSEEREKHEATHVGELKYHCTTCDKRFRGRGPLNKHLKIHSQERSYVCEQCGASFIQSNHLKQHVRTHTGEKPYACLMCGKNFAQSGTLYSHMKTHLAHPSDAKTSSGHTYYDSEESEAISFKCFDTVRSAVNMIEAKVA